MLKTHEMLNKIIQVLSKSILSNLYDEIFYCLYQRSSPEYSSRDTVSSERHNLQLGNGHLYLHSLKGSRNMKEPKIK